MYVYVCISKEKMYIEGKDPRKDVYRRKRAQQQLGPISILPRTEHVLFGEMLTAAKPAIS